MHSGVFRDRHGLRAHDRQLAEASENRRVSAQHQSAVHHWRRLERSCKGHRRSRLAKDRARTIHATRRARDLQVRRGWVEHHRLLLSGTPLKRSGHDSSHGELGTTHAPPPGPTQFERKATGLPGEGSQKGEAVPFYHALRPAPSKVGQDKVDALFKFTVQNMEEELCGIYDIEEDEKEKFKGRDAKPQMVWRQAGGAPCGKHPASDNEGRCWRLLQRRFEDVEVAIRKGNHNVAGRALETLAKDVRESGKAIGYKGKVEAQKVDAWKWMLAIGAGSQVQHESQIRAAKCAENADHVEKKFAAERAKSFREWARKSTLNGGGRHTHTRSAQRDGKPRSSQEETTPEKEQARLQTPRRL